MPLDPAALPRFDTETLALNNLLATRPLRVASDLPAGSARLRLDLPPERSNCGPAGFRFAAGSDDLIVGIEPAGQSALLPDVAAELSFEELPPALAKALANAYLRPALEAVLGGVGALSLIDGPESIPSGWQRAGLWLDEEESEAPAATFYLEPGLVDKLCTVLRDVEPPEAGDIDLAVPVLFSAGEVMLTQDELAGLEPGDVLLLGKGPDEMSATILAGTARRAIGVARVENSCLMVAEKVGDPEAAMDDDDEMAETSGDAPETGFVDDLEVKVVFSLGQVNVDVGTLRSLAPGFVFGLDQKPEGNVSLMVNGREIGVGELVTLDDALGVRVLKLNRRNDG